MSDATERRFWCHWQNLNDRLPGKRFPWNGRAWLHDRKRDTWGAIGEVEWGFGRHAWHTHLGVERQRLSVGIWRLFSVYLTLPFPIWPFKPCELSWHEGMLSWRLFAACRGFAPIPHDRPRWRDGSWFPLDTFLGRHAYSNQELETRDVVIPMPEGPYPATATLSLARWKRPRWPWARELLRVDIDCPVGIPFEGKGECSYDIGEDAYYGQCAPAQSIEEGVANLVQSVLERRKRYGKSEPGAYPHPSQRKARSEPEENGQAEMGALQR